MSYLTRKRIPTTVLLIAIVGVYLVGGIPFGSHTVQGAAGNGRVAFAGNDAQSNIQIYSENPDGSDIQQLTNGSNNSTLPVWSSDGTKIAYMGQDFTDLSTQIFVMSADGSHDLDVTNNDSTANETPTWSPDGTKIAYASSPSDYSTPSTIIVMSADGSSKTPLTDGTEEAFSPSWSPDSAKIAYICTDAQNIGQICIMNANGSNQQQITNSSTVSYTSVAYSPNGTEFAYTTNVTTAGDTGTIETVGTMNIDGSNPQIIVNQTTWGIDYANWSPDGTKLVYDRQDTTEGIQRIYSINTDGTSETVLSPDNQVAQTPSWQPIPTSDVDGDGSLNSVENAAPNNGDANGDGILDAYQSNVTSIVDPVTDAYVSIQSSCPANTAVSAKALPINYIDPAFNYPAGLVGFTTNCGTNGATATITQYYYGVPTQNTMVLRKYNLQTHTYTTVPGATVSAVTIGGQAVTKVTYQVTDGGPFDQDGVANGSIVDPVGLAVPSVGTPNTGVGGSVSFPRVLEAPLL